MKKTVKYLLLIIMICPIVVSAETIEKKEAVFTSLNPVLGVEKDRSDNYYITGGETNSTVLIKMNDKKEIIFKKNLEDTAACTALSLDEEGNIYTICRKNKIFEESHVPILQQNIYQQDHLIKWSKEGNVIFDVQLDNKNDYNDYNVIKIKDNKIYIAGYALQYVKHLDCDDEYCYYDYVRLKKMHIYDLSGRLIKTMQLGNVTLSQTMGFFNTPPSATGWGDAFYKNESIIFDDNYMYVSVCEVDGELFFGKYDLNGNKIWEKELGVGGNNSIVGLEKSNDGNFIAVGSIRSNNIEEIKYEEDNKTSPLIIKFSPNGDILYSKIIKGRGEVISIKNKDNGYYIVVSLRDKNIEEVNNENTGNYLLKYDYDFNIKDSVELENYSLYVNDIKNEGVIVQDNWGYFINYVSKTSNIKEENVVLLKKDKRTLANLFKDTDLDVTDKTLNWKIADESIVKIEEGEIIPLAVGETTISTVQKRIDYVVNVKVTEEDLPKGDIPSQVNEILTNPKTSTPIIMVIVVITIMAIISIRNIKKRNS